MSGQNRLLLPTSLASKQNDQTNEQHQSTSQSTSSVDNIKPAWFEFILSPATLKSHLQKPDCDPTATDLITQFFANLPGTQNSQQIHRNGETLYSPTPPSPTGPLSPPPTVNGQDKNGQLNHSTPVISSETNGHDPVAFAEDAKYRAKKAHALKRLALKAASFLDWNIELFESHLSLPTQLALMNELRNACNQPDTPNEYSLFANILHSRWFVRSSISFRLSRIQPEDSTSYNPQLLAPPYANNGLFDSQNNNTSINELNELFNNDTSPVDQINNFLKNLDLENGAENQPVEDNDRLEESKTKRRKLMSVSKCKYVKIKRPTIDCFDFRNSNNWDQGVLIDVQDFLESVLYDLGKYYFFGEMYQEARDVLQRIDVDNMVRTKYLNISSYLQSSIDILKTKTREEAEINNVECHTQDDEYKELADRIETYLSRKQSQTTKQKSSKDVEEGEISDMDEGATDTGSLTDAEEDLDIRLTELTNLKSNPNASSLLPPAMAPLSQMPMMSHMVATTNLNMPLLAQLPQLPQQDQLAILATQDRDERFIPAGGGQGPHLTNMAIDTQNKPINPPDERTMLTIKGEVFMSRGEHVQAMGNFVEVLTIMTEYFTHFSHNHLEEENVINRMIQCSIKLGCYTQAVVLYQMTNNLNYGVAFKQLNERFCNDCCDDLYECIWDVTLLEYIIHIHTKRGELERKCRLIQLIGQLELNENNSEEILFEAMQSRRARFFRIMAKKYL